MLKLWVTDIGEMPEEDRTAQDWARLGTHQALATVSRTMIDGRMTQEQRELLMRCIRTGVDVEAQRLDGTPLGWYYKALYQQYDIATLEWQKPYLRRIVA